MGYWPVLACLPKRTAGGWPLTGKLVCKQPSGKSNVLPDSPLTKTDGLKNEFYTQDINNAVALRKVYARDGVVVLES